MTYESFKKTVWEFYAQNKRSFSWRKTQKPYEILVSEFMLQQTQTARVVPKYANWLQKFPTALVLAQSPLSTVLTEWSGLGYNRRAKFLHAAAKVIAIELHNVFPSTYKELITLPGVGHYTANAMLAFAYNQPVPLVETNIRTAFLHHFFSNDQKVTEKEFEKIAQKTVDTENPREWYYALMDYGNWLKAEGIHYFDRQKKYRKQSPFKGSDRYVRGYLLREVLKHSKLKLPDIIIPGYTAETIEKIAKTLHEEGLIVKHGNHINKVV